MDKKTVLITGGNRGIGFATAKKFLDEGYIVILTARNEEAGKKAAAQLGDGQDLFFHTLDISKDDSVENIKAYIENTFGSIDILINNAAINYDTWQDALNADMDLVLETLNVNVLGAWRMAKAMIPLMQKNDYGRIINISSGLGLFDEMGSGTPAYSISKAALNALTVKLANTLAGSNITVNSLCPGWVKTDMGGTEAPRSPQEAAEDIYHLACNDNFTGKFIRNNKVISF